MVLVGAVVDVAGEVVEVGSGVKDFKAGDKVVSILGTFVSNSLILRFCSTLWLHLELRKYK